MMIQGCTNSFQEWSEKRLMEWIHCESYHSPMGLVQKTVLGWVGKVEVNGQYYRISEVFESAEVAKKCVERTWKREMEKK